MLRLQHNSRIEKVKLEFYKIKKNFTTFRSNELR